jgi:uncharacterized protein YecE (DUF72 family)
MESGCPDSEELNGAAPVRARFAAARPCYGMQVGTTRQRARVLVGCSGWSYPHWRGRVYPKDAPATRWLELYAATFDVVEVNATFYRLPTRKAVEQWARETPRGFTFAVKTSRYLTHVRRLRDIGAGVERFRERIAPLEDAGKLGPVLWQLPANFHRDDERLAAALEQLGPGRHAFEFRHPSWFADDVEALLRAHDVAVVVADSQRRKLPTPKATARWVYVRFHDGRGRDGNYSERQLAEWAARLRGARGYAFFNNDWEGFAVKNALELRELFGSRAGAPARADRRATEPLTG